MHFPVPPSLIGKISQNSGFREAYLFATRRGCLCQLARLSAREPGRLVFQVALS